jgi:hypothetical protein
LAASAAVKTDSQGNTSSPTTTSPSISSAAAPGAVPYSIVSQTDRQNPDGHPAIAVSKLDRGNAEGRAQPEVARDSGEQPDGGAHNIHYLSG